MLGKPRVGPAIAYEARRADHLLAPGSGLRNIAAAARIGLTMRPVRRACPVFRVNLSLAVFALGALAAGGAWAQARDAARARPLVVIDPGHGGKDPGAVSPISGIAEKHVTLAVSRAIRDALLQGGRVRVAMTRNDDRFVPLHERVAVARRLGANLFVAVHGDSAPNPDASGATIYTLSEVASDAQAARLAAAENRRDGVDDVDLGVSDPSVRAILADLTQRETMAVSVDFAQALRREAGATGVAFRAQHHRFANFVVLKAADTAAVLLESGYLTNERDMAFLASTRGRARLAVGMARAIESHFARQRIAGRAAGG